MELEIKGIDGQSSGANIALNQDIFGAAFNESLVHQIVIAYQAGARQGTKAQKNRAAVNGGGAKPWRQKGTGRARAGTNRSPIWRGGGNAFPASPRNFSQKVNRKSLKSAMRSILAELVRQDRLIVVDEFKFDQPKTRALSASLYGLEANNALLVDVQGNTNLELSARNLPFVSVASAANLNPVDLVNHDKVVISQQAMNELQEKLQ